MVGMCREMGAIITSTFKCVCTDVVVIVGQFVDGVVDEIDGFGLRFVGLPVASDHTFIPGEAVGEGG